MWGGFWASPGHLSPFCVLPQAERAPVPRRGLPGPAHPPSPTGLILVMGTPSPPPCSPVHITVTTSACPCPHQASPGYWGAQGCSNRGPSAGISGAVVKGSFLGFPRAIICGPRIYTRRVCGGRQRWVSDVAHGPVPAAGDLGPASTRNVRSREGSRASATRRRSHGHVTSDVIKGQPWGVGPGSLRP